MRRRRLLVGLGVTCAVLWAVVAVVVVRRDDGDRSGSDGGDEYPRIREELLDGIHPNPDCPDAEAYPTPGEGEVLISVVRAVDGCLRYAGEVAPEDEVDDRLEERRAEPDVVAADRAVERALVGTGALAGRPGQDEPDQWALAPEHLDGEEVRSLWPADSAEVRVAVLDDGIDGDHLDLANQVVERAPWASGEDIDDKHGTHVAGIVAAADDGAGAIGLTPAARLMDVQYKVNGGEDWAGPGDDVGEYIRWAVDHGADVVNMSFGSGETSDTDLTAVLYAERRGVVLVAGAGNCGLRVEWRIEGACRGHNDTLYPAAYDQVLSVANHKQDGERYTTSSVNETVDIAAPGSGIVSTCPTEGSDTRRTCEADGTSMAAPFVAATAALLRARQPDATPAAIREAIIRSARTEHPGTRTDELGWGLLDPAAAAEYLDAHPGEPQPRPGPLADRTQAAYVHDGTLYAYDGEASSPVREVGDDHTVQSVVWSGDHTRLVGADDDTLFSWGGPGSDLVEVECQGCAYNEVAYLDDIAVTDPADTATGDLVVTLADDGTLTRWSPATLEPQGTVPLGVRGGGGDVSAVLQGAVGDSLLVLVSGGVGGRAELWRVDPFSGEGQVSHDVVGGWGGRTATNAAGNLVAYVSGGPIDGTCDDVEEAVVLDAESLSPVADPDLERNVVFDEIFFDGDTLYATGERIEVNADGACPTAGSAGLWRAAGDSFELADADIAAGRPLEGMAGDEPTGWLVVTEGEEGHLVPNSVESLEDGEALGTINFGTYTEGLWATPTRSEVPRGEGSGGGGGSPSGSGGGGSSGDGELPSEGVDAAIARYEEFLHALGEEDIDTVCEIAGPAAQIAEDEGFGPCEQTFGIVFDMISPEQSTALRTATVDPDRVEVRSDTEVEIPVDAIVADVTFTEDELGDSTLRHQDGDWFIVE